MLCQAIITTAIANTAALNNSWPVPSAKSAIVSVRAAKIKEPITPQVTPMINQRVRWFTPRVAAAMMPMTRAASRVSRKIMRAEPNIIFYSAMTTPRAVAWLNSPKKGYLPAFKGPIYTTPLLFAGIIFSRFNS